jgi:hypothetical protein
MPPRKKETEEEKEAKFSAWKEGPEYLQLKKFADARAKNLEASKIEVASNDIYSDWTEVLVEFF